MTKVLITGGAGFIGSHTVDYLLAQNMDVVVLDNLATGKMTNLDLNHPRLSFVEGSVLDFSVLKKTLESCDAVLHLAALPSVLQSIQNPCESLQVNTLGFLNVLQAIRDLNKNIRLVYASSAAVYGNSLNLPCNDLVPLPEKVLSPYALEKANNERYAELFANLFSIKSLGLRYFNVYGPRQDPHSHYSGVIAKFMTAYAENKIIKIFGDGKQSRDFIFVNDIARANFLALTSDVSGVLNIATGQPETLIDLISYLEKMGAHKAKYEFEKERLGDIKTSYADVSHAKKVLKFTAEISLEDGIRKSLA